MADRCGLDADRIRNIAAEFARVAFDEEITLDQPWTDWKGEQHATMIGRPISFHAMRGISAHSNGFQTARALHVLQILLGSVEVPGGFRFKPPYPKPAEAHPKPHAGVTPGKPLDGPHLGYPMGPEHLLIDDDGKAKRIDKAFTWENPLSAHGLMHMVISNAHAGDPYKIDTLFLYHGQHGLELVDEHRPKSSRCSPTRTTTATTSSRTSSTPTPIRRKRWPMPT